MSDKPISVGDLAIVVRDCCGHWLGRVFRVSSIQQISLPAWIRCSLCARELSNIEYVRTDQPNVRDAVIHAPLGWLRRIPPIEECDEVSRDEGITA